MHIENTPSQVQLGRFCRWGGACCHNSVDKTDVYWKSLEGIASIDLCLSGLQVDDNLVVGWDLLGGLRIW
jgi:hypothetical protein